MSLNFPTRKGGLAKMLIRYLAWCVLICSPGVIAAEEWINVLDPGQRISKDSAGSFKEFKTIPDLAVVSVQDLTQSKTVNVKYEIHAVLKDAVQKENRRYDTLYVPGCGFHFDPGQPDIPAKSIFLEIPTGSTYSVNVKSPKTTRLENIDFLPAQPLPQDNMAFEPIDFEKDTTLYSRDAFFPKNNIISTREFKVRGHRMLEVVVSPIQYNPVTKTIKMSPSLDVRVDIQKGSSGRLGGGGFRDSGYMDLFSSGLKDFSGAREMKKAPAKPFRLEKYMILMNPQFKGNKTLEKFILWKKKKGYAVKVVTTADVNAEAGSNDTFNNCVKFMRSLPQSDYPVP